MIRRCEDCGRGYDDVTRSTVCPHDGIGGLCVKHDLYACDLCEPKTAEAQQ